MFAKNEIGSIQPIRELYDVAHAHGALFHTDAVQAVGHVKIDVQELGVSIVSFVVATIVLPEPSVEQQIGGLALSGTYISTNKDRELIFDGKTATLYENGEQIQTGTYEYRSERSINIHYEDYGELLIYTVDTKEILYQGKSNSINLDEVEYVKEGVANHRAALIDSQGKILWESALTKNDQVLNEKSEFVGGLAYFVYNGNDKSNYNIIDSNGNVTFTRDCGEDYIILGHGNGLFLVAEHTVNFDSNEWKIAAIDKSGNVVAPLKAYEEIVSFDSCEYSSSEYLGENIYRLDFHGWYVFLNAKTQSIIYTDKSGDSGSIRDFIAHLYAQWERMGQ